MTAVEWLIMQLPVSIRVELYEKNIHLQAKEMEKQQIIDAFDEGQEYEYQVFVNSAPRFFSDTYYNETYGSKGSDDHIVETNEMVSSQTEISDEEIEIEGWKYCYENKISLKNIVPWINACEWYREQLNKL